MGIRQPGIDVIRQPGFFKVVYRLFVASFIDLDRDEFATRLAERPCHPDRGTAGGGADFHGFPVIVFNDQVVENLPIRFRDIPVDPFSPLAG